jgi:hypothetical protein
MAACCRCPPFALRVFQSSVNQLNLATRLAWHGAESAQHIPTSQNRKPPVPLFCRAFGTVVPLGPTVSNQCPDLPSLRGLPAAVAICGRFYRGRNPCRRLALSAPECFTYKQPARGASLGRFAGAAGFERVCRGQSASRYVSSDRPLDAALK